MEEENKDKKNIQGKKYELGYLLTPLLSADKVVETLTEKVILPLEALQITVISQRPPQLLELAYTIYETVEHKRDKYNQAYFGNIVFMAKTEDISKIKEILDKSGIFLRYLLINSKPTPVVKARKIDRVDNKPKTEVKKEEVDPEVKEKKIDEEIEDLLIINQ